MEAIAWAIVFTVSVFDYREVESRSYERPPNKAFTGFVAGVSVVMLILQTAAPWLT